VWCNLNLKIISPGSRTRDFTIVGRYNYRCAVKTYIKLDVSLHGVTVVIPTNDREIPGSTPGRYNLQIKIASIWMCYMSHETHCTSKETHVARYIPQDTFMRLFWHVIGLFWNIVGIFGCAICHMRHILLVKRDTCCTLYPTRLIYASLLTCNRSLLKCFRHIWMCYMSNETILLVKRDTWSTLYLKRHIYGSLLTCNRSLLKCFRHIWMCNMSHDTHTARQKRHMHATSQKKKMGLFWRVIGLFWNIVGLLWHMIGTFRHVTGLFCRSLLTCVTSLLTFLRSLLTCNSSLLPRMGWLRWVGCFKIQVSLQNTGLFCRAFLQKRPIFLSILLIVATPYQIWVLSQKLEGALLQRQLHSYS